MYVRLDSSTDAMSATDGKSPADFLKAIKGKHVLVKLNSGVDYRGASRRVAFHALALISSE